MKPRKQDWKDLEQVMPGVVPSGQKPSDTGRLFSISGNADGSWSIIEGSLHRTEKEKVTQRMAVHLHGNGLEVSSELLALGFELPLMEQWEGDLDLPTPKDLYFAACCEKLPGLFLTEAGEFVRVGLSLTAARRTGWKLHFFEEADEDELFSGGYLEALQKGEFPTINVLGGWEGRKIGSRRGVIRDGDLEAILGWFGVDPAVVFGYGPERPAPSRPIR